MDSTEVITVLSLCTGYGGLEFGLSRALENPLRVVAVEVEAFALANLVAKAETSKLAIEALWPDLRTFPAARFRGCFDFVIAGYPCQPFSVAGKREGESDPRHLWPAIARIVQAVEPVWCFFENVPGHLTLGFPSVYRSLRDMGYSVEAGLFTAAEVGAPHKRERLFILAHSERIDDRRTPRQVSGKNEQQTKERQKRRFTEPCSTSQLADTAKQRMEGYGQAGNAIINQNGPEALSGCSGERINWPSRPGEPQYEWEEPRVVADTKIRSRQNTQRVRGCSTRNSTGIQGQGDEEAQSRLGRTVDGARNRVDRLRLLGNGVVPQQAEKAFRYLYEKFSQQSQNKP